MSQITQFPGPLDSLFEGIMAGSKIRLVGAELKARQMQNALIEQELQHGNEKFQMFTGAQQAATEHEQALTEHTKAQTALLGQHDELDRQLQELQIQNQQSEMKARDEGSARAGRAEGRATQPEERELQSRMAAMAQGLATPQELTPQEAGQMAAQMMTAMGVKFKEGDASHQLYTNLISQRSQMMKQELDQETKKANLFQRNIESQIESRRDSSQHQLLQDAIEMRQNASKMSPEETSQRMLLEDQAQSLIGDISKLRETLFKVDPATGELLDPKDSRTRKDIQKQIDGLQEKFYEVTAKLLVRGSPAAEPPASQPEVSLDDFTAVMDRLFSEHPDWDADTIYEEAEKELQGGG